VKGPRYLVVIGTLLIAVGIMVMNQPRAFMQEAPEAPPYLAEFYDEWSVSAHADVTAEAFVHWDAEGEIPETCAKCHSTPGYRDFLGADGTEFGVVDAPAPIGTTVSCDACHNNVTMTLDSVVFPSGAMVTGAGDAARCMQCHQGRASTDSVNARLTELGVLEDMNAVNAELGFINIHYYAAAATLYGSVARGGYQYEGLVYMMQNHHVEEADTCNECHNPHTLEIQLDLCATCHEDVEGLEDLRFIRMQGSGNDYDGDDDTDEGIAEEIEGLQELLYEAIQAYASEVSGTPIVYDAQTHPYFFIDGNDNGEVDEGEAVRDNSYPAFTGNLLTAAYNYQVTMKDPGGFAHNPLYMIQLLYDSIMALNGQISDPVDMEFAARTDPGHFDVTAEAFRHWDAEGEVPGTCARCHSAGGLQVWLANGTNIAEPIANSLMCTTCHTSLSEFTIPEVNEVTFPSGARLGFGEGVEDNLCLSCHQGRESTVSVNRAISSAGVADDEVSESLAFRNVHYFAAGASLFGGDAMGAYQYEGHEYNGRNMHGDDEDAPVTCTGCHRTHEFSIRIGVCEDCHEEVEDPEDVLSIRMLEDVDLIDYDGDGDAEEPIRDEIATLEEALLAALQSYATNTVGTSVAYDSHSHPYFFIDSNGNAVADEDEVNGDNRYATWTPTLLRAAYNYQYAQKDPGDFAHNPDYILQILYDSIEAVGGDVSAYTRPPVDASE
jgi:hypothetical protein